MSSSKRSHAKPNFSDLPRELQHNIMLDVATNSIADCRKVILMYDAFEEVKEDPKFYRTIKFDDLPRDPRRTPTSAESQFFMECHAANNPEVYFRMLLVDVFEHGIVDHIEYLLVRVQGLNHPDATYAAIIFKILAYSPELNRKGKEELIELRKDKEGKLALDTMRFNLISKVAKMRNYNLLENLALKRYCIRHHLKKPQHRNRMKCHGCMADFEISCFAMENYVHWVLNFGRKP